MLQIDGFDRKILSLLQVDARLTSNELAERINLSPSQCARRRQRLEEEGYIKSYHAELNREALGYGLLNIIIVTLATHNRDNVTRFARLISGYGEVQEAFSMTGEMDYLLKVVTRDLKELAHFVNNILLPHETVQRVKTAIVLEILKETKQLPL